jgi:hypothetical protein
VKDPHPHPLLDDDVDEKLCGGKQTWPRPWLRPSPRRSHTHYAEGVPLRSAHHPPPSLIARPPRNAARPWNTAQPHCCPPPQTSQGVR